jgi:hypothetical protein
MDTPEPAAPPVPDAPSVPDEGLSDEEKQKLADSLESLMLEIQRDEENWALDDRLDFLLKTG